MKTISEAWESYLNEVIPKHAGPVQCLESKRAFFSGAAMMMQLLAMENTSPEELAEEMNQFLTACREDRWDAESLIILRRRDN